MDDCECYDCNDGAHAEDFEATKVVGLRVGSKNFQFSAQQAVSLLLLDGLVWIAVGFLLARAL